MFFLRPRIAEVEVDQGYFARREVLVEVAAISVKNLQVRQVFPDLMFQDRHDDTGLNFNTDVVNFRMTLSHFHDKASLTGTNFDMNRLFLGETGLPPATECLRLLRHILRMGIQLFLGPRFMT